MEITELLSAAYIKGQIADSPAIFQRGMRIFNNGGYHCTEYDPDTGCFEYVVDGNYGDYDVIIELGNDTISTSCNCPYPADGCKHIVAMLLDLSTRLDRSEAEALQEAETPVLSEAEIREQALEERIARAKSEQYQITRGEMFKGAHLLETQKGRQYIVTLHDPQASLGHCTCPDYLTNRLGTCKHIIHLSQVLQAEKGFEKQIQKERFPYINIYWDSTANCPRLFNERPIEEGADLNRRLSDFFNDDGTYSRKELKDLIQVLPELRDVKQVKIEQAVFAKLDEELQDQQLEEMSRQPFPGLDFLKTKLYPYQEEGVRFGLFRKGVLIGDEMGLGKTLQAIALAILKRDLFGFEKVLVVTLASLKEQWKREIERFTDMKAAIVAGNPKQRREIYEDTGSFFKIANYESVRRDVDLLNTINPDLVILDEAQRIKNLTTKTAEAVKRIPKKHGIILTGTPLENKLEDVYSIVQFLDPNMLSPLWQFAADYFMLSPQKKGNILGYKNLDKLHKRLKPIVIRRRKEEVLKDLPEQIENNYYIDLHPQQYEIHAGFYQSLVPILNKKFLTPMDVQRMQRLLLMMRMVCDSTYLIDHETNISPKLAELENILDDLVVQNKRKVVIFSEWTNMTYLIAKHLSKAKIDFVELTGKVPVPKRQALIDEFTENPDCRVFLSSDAGGTGLNLQAADCVINFELPWNPAKIQQRIGRVNRIGQEKSSINVVNLISRNTIEERIMAGLQLKTDLFQGVFDGTTDMVEFSREKRAELLEKLRSMMEDDQFLQPAETTESEEIPADTPHFLNPKVLQEEEAVLAYDAEENAETAPVDDPANEIAGARPLFENQPAEKVEEVLNNGLNFIGGLLEMATGKKIEKTAGDSQMIRINKETGEVTMTFKLPGF